MKGVSLAYEPIKTSRTAIPSFDVIFKKYHQAEHVMHECLVPMSFGQLVPHTENLDPILHMW